MEMQGQLRRLWLYLRTDASSVSAHFDHKLSWLFPVRASDEAGYGDSTAPEEGLGEGLSVGDPKAGRAEVRF
jgi:hypothetical protein